MINNFGYFKVKGLIQTEKSSKDNQSCKYCFEVDPSFNKLKIGRFISDFFSVSVKKVNIINVSGKVKKFKGKSGITSNYKKALVTLDKGNYINIQDLK